MNLGSMPTRDALYISYILCCQCNRIPHRSSPREEAMFWSLFRGHSPPWGKGVVLEPLISMARGPWGSVCSYLSSPGSTETKLCPLALPLEFYIGQLDSVSTMMSPDGSEHSKQQPMGAMPHSNHNTHFQGCAGTYWNY